MVRGWCDRVMSWYGAGVTISWYTAGVTMLIHGIHGWCDLVRGWCDTVESLQAVSVYINFTVGFIWRILSLCFCGTIDEKTFRFCLQIHLTAVKFCLLIHIRQLVLSKLKCSANILNQKESWPDFEFGRKITFVWVASCRLTHVENRLLKKKNIL
jgi:hypothetical protein